MLSRHHLLRSSQIVPRLRDEVFAFFAEAENLEAITPSSLRFEIATPSPITMQEGTLIDYRLRLFGVPFSWKTRITRWEPGVSFVDEQISGPYAVWVHTHTFSDVDGGTLVEDEVAYRLPLYPIGEIALPLVKRQLDYIFAFRREAIERMLG
jgi:ligand-binding SRPBCC domain-containing protein